MAIQKDSRPWHKEPWPWILMAGPAIVVVAGVITLWLAITSNDGLVTDDYYKQGLAVNQSLDRQRQAANLGLYADLMRSGTSLRLLLRSEDLAMTLPKELTLKLAHPTRSGQDQLVQMKAEGQGFYSGQLSTDIVGRWLLSIEDPAGKWRLHGDWKMDSQDQIQLLAKADK